MGRRRKLCFSKFSEQEQKFFLEVSSPDSSRYATPDASFRDFTSFFCTRKYFSSLLGGKNMGANFTFQLFFPPLCVRLPSLSSLMFQMSIWAFLTRCLTAKGERRGGRAKRGMRTSRNCSKCPPKKSPKFSQSKIFVLYK